MRRRKSGFTLIEVTIFLAISGLLFFAVTIGVQNSVYQQRSNDSVQSFMEFLRRVYSNVTNVQNKSTSNPGQSNNAIYGRVAVFDNNSVTVYGVIGDANKDTLPVLTVSNSVAEDNYTPKWGAKIEVPCGSNCPSNPKKGSLLVVRNPFNGAVNVYWSDETVKNGDSNIDVSKSKWTTGKDIDFCIKPDGAQTSGRKDVRISANARNASGILLFSDGGDNKCVK